MNIYFIQILILSSNIRQQHCITSNICKYLTSHVINIVFVNITIRYFIISKHFIYIIQDVDEEIECESLRHTLLIYIYLMAISYLVNNELKYRHSHRYKVQYIVHMYIYVEHIEYLLTQICNEIFTALNTHRNAISFANVSYALFNRNHRLRQRFLWRVYYRYTVGKYLLII